MDGQYRHLDLGTQACTESSYHNFRKERLSAAEAGAAASQAEEPKSPCLVPAEVQTESATLLDAQPAVRPESTPQHEPHWVKIHPSVGILHIRACLGLAGGWVCSGLSARCCVPIPACCTIGDDVCALHMSC